MKKNNKIILVLHYLHEYFGFWTLFYKKIQKLENSRLTKNIFSYLLNWNLGHLQSSVDGNEIPIGKISVRAIQKLSYFDQQMIVGGPNLDLTNGKISFFFPYFFVHSVFAKISSFCFNFD